MTLVGNVTDINDKIYDAARPGGRPSAELAAEMAARVHRRHRPARARAAGRRAVRDRVRGPDHRADPAADRQRIGLRGVRATCTSACARSTRYGELSRRDLDQMDQGEGVEGADLKEDPLDFALWKATEGGRGHLLGLALGPRAGRAGTSSARRWPRRCWASSSTSTAAASTSSSRTTRTRRRRRWPRAGSRWPGSGCTTGCSSSAREKMAKSVGNIRGLGEVLDAVGGEVLVLFFSSGHYRQPLAFSEERLEDAQRVRRADPRGGAAAGRRPVAGGAGAVPGRVLRRAAQRLQHGRGAGLAVRLDSRGEPLRGAGRRRAPARDARRARARAGCWPPSEGPPEEAVELAALRDQARRDKDWAEADRLRDELRAHGLGGPRRAGRARTGPGVMSGSRQGGSRGPGRQSAGRTRGGPGKGGRAKRRRRARRRAGAAVRRVAAARAVARHRVAAGRAAVAALRAAARADSGTARGGGARGWRRLAR